MECEFTCNVNCFAFILYRLFFFFFTYSVSCLDMKNIFFHLNIVLLSMSNIFSVKLSWLPCMQLQIDWHSPDSHLQVWPGEMVRSDVPRARACPGGGAHVWLGLLSVRYLGHSLYHDPEAKPLEWGTPQQWVPKGHRTINIKISDRMSSVQCFLYCFISNNVL